MNTISNSRLAYDSNRMVFAKNALFAILALIVLFSVEGKLSSQNLDELLLCFTFTPIATGLAGIIFKNTAGLRHSSGLKKVLGYVIGVLAYVSFIVLALSVVYSGF